MPRSSTTLQWVREIMKNLKMMRKECGFTQKNFADALNISQQCYSDYENERTNPDIATLIQIADLLKTSTDYLLGRTDDLGDIVIQGENNFPTSLLEQRLILDFRKLPAEIQEDYVEFFHSLLRDHALEKILFKTSLLEQELVLDFRKLPAETQDNFVKLFHNLAMSV